MHAGLMTRLLDNINSCVVEQWNRKEGDRALDPWMREVTTLAENIIRTSAETIAAIKCLNNQGMALTEQDGLELEAGTRFEIHDTNERLREFRR